MSELPNVADFDYTSMCALGSNRCACGPVKGLDNFWNMLDDSWNVLEPVFILMVHLWFIVFTIYLIRFLSSVMKSD